jgi:hypothetical protein
MSDSEFDVQLELKERLSYPELLQKSMYGIKQALNSDNPNMSKVNTMILDLMFDIPKTWYDTQFQDDIKSIVKVRKVPNIIKFAGVQASKEYMKRHKKPLTKEVREVNYFRLKNAIINLLDRRNMLVRKDKIEYSTGDNMEIGSIDDLIEQWNEDDLE